MSIVQSLSAFAEPEIAARAKTALLAAAGVGVGVLALSVALPRRLPFRDIVVPAAQNAFFYLLIGLMARFAIQHHRSRLQMLILLCVVAVVEIARYRPGEARPRAATWLAGSVAVCLGVLAAKWALEPGAISETFSALARSSGA